MRPADLLHRQHIWLDFPDYSLDEIVLVGGVPPHTEILEVPRRDTNLHRLPPALTDRVHPHGSDLSSRRGLATSHRYAAAVSIREIFIAARNTGEDEYTEPPSRELSLAVIGGNAHLSVTELDERGRRRDESATRDLIVPARSLLRALQSATDDDEAHQEQ